MVHFFEGTEHTVADLGGNIANLRTLESMGFVQYASVALLKLPQLRGDESGGVYREARALGDVVEEVRKRKQR